MRPLLMLALLLPAACAPTYVNSIAPVCRRPEVMTFLDTALRRHDPYAEILPATALERTTANGVSQCAAQVRDLVFDTPVLGRTPAIALRPIAYTVREAAGGGLVVDLGPSDLRR